MVDISRSVILQAYNTLKSLRKVSKLYRKPLTLIYRLLTKKQYYNKKDKINFYSARVERFITRSFNRRVITNAKQFHKSNNIPGSYQYFLDWLRKNGFSYKTPTKKPFLKANSIKKRIKFALEHVSIPGLSEKVIFTDEKRFSLYGPGTAYRYWCPINEAKSGKSKIIQVQYFILKKKLLCRRCYDLGKYFGERKVRADYGKRLHEIL